MVDKSSLPVDITLNKGLLMKILVPCDFSKISNNAALYAAKFANQINAEIILFHVTWVEEKISDPNFPVKSRDCAALAYELKSAVEGVKISFKVDAGFPIESLIEDYAVNNKIDLIVMGTKGASGLKKALFGSNAVNLINISSIPIITVPEYARFSNLKHIVYASDTSIITEMHPRIQKLILLAQLFNASIYILHVLPQYPLDSDKKIDVVKIKDSLINKYKYKEISFHISHNEDVIEAINDFVADKKTDLLAMFTHDSTFFENIFNTSVSREMAFHSLVPLLTIKE